MIMPEQLAKPGTEHSHQVALFCWANQQVNAWRANTHRPGCATDNALADQLSLMFAIPNGGLRHKATAGNLKAEGVKAGVPDIMLPVPQRITTSKGYPVAGYEQAAQVCGLFIEMKKPSEKPSITLSGRPLRAAGKVSSKQAEWHNLLQLQGYQVAVCYSWEEARDVILAYLGAT